MPTTCARDANAARRSIGRRRDDAQLIHESAKLRKPTLTAVESRNDNMRIPSRHTTTSARRGLNSPMSPDSIGSVARTHE